MSTDNQTNTGRLGPPAAELPLAAAYQVGRRLKQLHVLACEHCLRLAERSRVQTAFDNLRSAARNAVYVEHRETVQQVIETEREDFWLTRDSESWSEEYFVHDRRMMEFGGGNYSELVREGCTLILGCADEAVENVKVAIRAVLDDREKAALELGYLTELGQRHCEAERAAINEPRVALYHSDILARDCRSHFVKIVSWTSWLRDQRQRRTELNLAIEALPSVAALTDLSESETDIARVFAAFHSGLATVERVPEPRRANNATSRVNDLWSIELQEETRTIRDTGSGLEAHIESPFQWEMLKLLLSHRGEYIRTRVLIELACAELGFNDCPSNGQADIDLHQLNGRISNLGVVLESRVRLGWRVVNNPLRGMGIQFFC